MTDIGGRPDTAAYADLANEIVSKLDEFPWPTTWEIGVGFKRESITDMFSDVVPQEYDHAADTGCPAQLLYSIADVIETTRENIERKERAMRED